MDHNSVWDFLLLKLSACSMDPETAATCTPSHFNQKKLAMFVSIRSEYEFDPQESYWGEPERVLKLEC